jgi:hypothetical protein
VLSGKPCNIVTATAILQGLDQQVLGEVVHEYKDLVTTARAIPQTVAAICSKPHLWSLSLISNEGDEHEGNGSSVSFVKGTSPPSSSPFPLQFWLQFHARRSPAFLPKNIYAVYFELFTGKEQIKFMI